MNFFSDLSLWWSLPWLVISVALTFWYYNGQKVFKQTASWKRGLLLFLRSAGLFLLGVLLLGILFESKDIKTQKPVLINLIDNSSSMLNYKDSSLVQNQLTDYLKDFNVAFGDRYEIQNFIIDDELRASDANFNGSVSNHNKGFDEIFNRYYNQNKGAIVFTSDGNYNIGNSPVYSAQKISLTPIYTIGVGDTVPKVDHLIRNVSANEIAFYKNDFPVNVEIEANKIPPGDYAVELWSGDKQVGSQTITYDDSKQQFHTAKFVVNAASIGFVSFEVRLQSLKGESSFVNNKRKFYVEVIDSRSKVLMLADGPHPDFKAIRQMLELDENIEVVSELASEWNGKMNDVSLLIMRLSGGSDEKAVLDQARSKRIPVMNLLGTQLTVNKANLLSLGLNYPSGASLDEVQVYIDEGFTLFEISENLRKEIQRWPPMKVRFGKSVVNGGNVLLKQKIGPVLKSDHVISFTTRNGRKEAFIIGEGLWRWRLDDFRRNQNNDNFKEFISSITQYLLVKQNKYPLRIKLPKRFNVRKEVIIDAEFYNDALQQITNPEVNLILINDLDKQSTYTFSKNALDYNLSLGRMKAGRYKWRAYTEWNGKKYEKNGEFVVEDVSLEKMDTHADHDILKTISKSSGAEFYSLDRYKELIEDLQQRKDVNTVSYEESTFSELIEYILLCILIVLLFSIEWFIRKYEGAY
jgi:hypothetical protein